VSLWLKGMLNGWLALNPQANVTCGISHSLYSHTAAIDISIERAIANLLDNAMKASATSIALNAGMQGTSLTVEVHDNGCGIPVDALRAYESGQPIESSSGMGIGLLLARAAVERQGGTLDIRQAGTSGTSACLTLPTLSIREVKHAA
jgi:two-component system, sensor histidine kinase RegB